MHLKFVDAYAIPASFRGNGVKPTREMTILSSVDPTNLPLPPLLLSPAAEPAPRATPCRHHLGHNLMAAAAHNSTRTWLAVALTARRAPPWPTTELDASQHCRPRELDASHLDH
jgi:hypothetical protein